MEQGSSYDLSRVHEADLAILDIIDTICRKYKIRYYLDAGTLLGAVRHQGFIPWDDDVDLVMTRESYEAFAKVVQRELPANMEFLTPDSFRHGKAFYDFTPRVIAKNSRTHEPGPEMDYYDGKLNHIWVDIFILDNLPENGRAASWIRLIQKGIYGLSMGHRYHVNYSGYSLKNRIFVGLLSTIGKIIPMKFLFAMQSAVSRKYRKRRTSRYYYSNYQPDYIDITVQKEWYARTVSLEFENSAYMAPCGWDSILKLLYGDYRKLPPVSQRVPSHSTVEITIMDEGKEWK